MLVLIGFAILTLPLIFFYKSGCRDEADLLQTFSHLSFDQMTLHQRLVMFGIATMVLGFFYMSMVHTVGAPTG